MITVNNLTKTYGKFNALRNISLEINDGEFVAIIGESGSGKSTLLNIIGQIDFPSSGEIIVDGENTVGLDDKETAKLRNSTFGFVFQAFYLEPTYTVYRNVEIPLILKGMKRKDRKQRIEEVLNSVDMQDKLKNKASNLSGGEMQRVAIARAIANNPPIIIADEPCGNLDTKNGDVVMRLLRDLHEQGKTILMVTHSYEHSKWADRVSFNNILHKKMAYAKVIIGFFLAFLVNFLVLFYSNSLTNGYEDYENSSADLKMISVFGNLTDENSVPNHSNYFEYKNVRHRVELSADRYVTIYCYYVSGFTRHSVYKNLTGNAGWVTLWEDKAQTLCDQNDIVQEDIDDLKDNLAVINEECNIQKFIKRKSEELYDELFHYWIEGTYNNENLAVSTDISIAERIELAEQLLEAGEKELIKSAQPTFTMSAETINFLPLIDFAEFTDQLSLGRTITIEKNEKISYRPALMEISYDLDEGDSFSLTFSSAAKPNSTAMTFAELIKEASDTSRTVTSNWADLTDYAKNKDSITSLVNAPLNRALRSIQAGLSNQAFIIDETGILGRRYKDDSQTSFADEQVRLINNLLVFTDDNWKTVKTALGKTDYGYGLVAEVLIGKLILGDRISIGSNSERVSISDLGIQIKNDAGEIVFNADEEGNLTMSGIIHAEEGGTIGGFIIGKHTITTRDSATTYTINQARAIFTPEPYVGLCSDLGADYAIWAGSKEAAKAPFYIKHDGYLYATNARIEGYINASEGYIGGFTVNTEAIFDGTTQENSKIAMRADGKFIAKDAVIEGNGSFDELYVSENFTVKNANIGNLLQANQMSTTKIAFGDGSYVITTGSIDTSGTITARLEVYKKYNGGQPSAPYFKVSLYKSDGSYYYTDVPRSFSCSVTGYLWTTGIKTLTLTVTIPVNSYKAEEIYSTLGNYDLSNPRFDSSQSDVLYFAVGGAAGGFVINCDLLPQKNVQTDLGSPDLRFKRIYCDEIICTKINGKDQS